MKVLQILYDRNKINNKMMNVVLKNIYWVDQNYLKYGKVMHTWKFHRDIRY